MKIIPVVLAVGLLSGCASGSRDDAQVQRAKAAVMSRDEAHARLAHANLIHSIARPSSGWQTAALGENPAGRAAARFESDHPGLRVENCEVYGVGGPTNAPLTAGGDWRDFLFFDSQNKLLGYERKFLN